MKRHGHLWPELISFANLHRFAMKARRGKRDRPAVLRFHFHLERELWRLHDELVRHTYRPGPYRTFTIHEPKERLISAAPYRDRVVHHALCNVLEPIYERLLHPRHLRLPLGQGHDAGADRLGHVGPRPDHFCEVVGHRIGLVRGQGVGKGRA